MMLAESFVRGVPIQRPAIAGDDLASRLISARAHLPCVDPFASCGCRSVSIEPSSSVFNMASDEGLVQRRPPGPTSIRPRLRRRATVRMADRNRTEFDIILTVYLQEKRSMQVIDSTIERGVQQWLLNRARVQRGAP